MKKSYPIFDKTATFKYNPFGGISQEELSNIIVPKKEFNSIISIIQNKKPSIIELVGKKGRGKTTHLIYLQKYFPESSILHLDKKSQFDPSILKMNILFIDSIHHFNFFQRKQI